MVLPSQNRNLFIELEEKMTKLVGRKGSQVLLKMQKAVISLTLDIARFFKTVLYSRKPLINLTGTIKSNYHIMILRDIKKTVRHWTKQLLPIRVFYIILSTLVLVDRKLKKKGLLAILIYIYIYL